jgi:ABC-2 type transport system permease protein
MSNIWIIGRREFKLFFISPIAYVVTFIILLILGIIFYGSTIGAADQQFPLDIQVVVGPLVTLVLFTTPAITMRTLAEEQRTGTMELLLTAPIRDWELIVGKWLGALLFLITVLGITLIYPLILNQIITPVIDLGTLISSYIGLVLLASALTAVGVAASSLFSNQIVAFFTSLGIFLILWMIGFPSQTMTGAGGEVFKYLDLSGHFYNTFYLGVIELQDIIYFISMTTLALFLGTLSIEIRRWR